MIPMAWWQHVGDVLLRQHSCFIFDVSFIFRQGTHKTPTSCLRSLTDRYARMFPISPNSIWYHIISQMSYTSIPASPSSSVWIESLPYQVKNTFYLHKLLEKRIISANFINLFSCIVGKCSDLSKAFFSAKRQISSEISRLDKGRYEPLVVCVRLMICLTYAFLYSSSPMSRNELPPCQGCHRICAYWQMPSAPAAIAEIGKFSPK